MTENSLEMSMHDHFIGTTPSLPLDTQHRAFHHVHIEFVDWLQLPDILLLFNFFASEKVTKFISTESMRLARKSSIDKVLDLI